MFDLNKLLNYTEKLLLHAKCKANSVNTLSLACKVMVAASCCGKDTEAACSGWKDEWKKTQDTPGRKPVGGLKPAEAGWRFTVQQDKHAAKDTMRWITALKSD